PPLSCFKSTTHGLCGACRPGVSIQPHRVRQRETGVLPGATQQYPAATNDMPDCSAGARLRNTATVTGANECNKQVSVCPAQTSVRHQASAAGKAQKQDGQPMHNISPRPSPGSSTQNAHHHIASR